MIDEFVRGFIQGVFIGGVVWGLTASCILLMFCIGVWSLFTKGILKFKPGGVVK